MECYHTLMKNEAVEPEMLSVFLSTPFQAIKEQPAVLCDGHTPSTASPSTSNQTTSKLNIVNRKNTTLLQQNKELNEHNSVLTRTIKDPSGNKRQLQMQLEEVIQQNRDVQQMQENCKQQQKLIRRLNSANMIKLRKQLKKLNTDLRTSKNRLVAAQTQANARKRKATTEQIDCIKRKKKVSKLEKDIATLQQQQQDLIFELNSLHAKEKMTRPLREEKNRFSDSIRQTLIQLQGDDNIPASNE